MQLVGRYARPAAGTSVLPASRMHSDDFDEQETLELVHAGHNKTGEVAITTLDFPDNETTTFCVGTEEGNIYQANRYDRAGAKAGLNQYDVYKGHSGPIMGLHCHPLNGPVDFSDLFLTSSVDWTVKLWRSKPASASGVNGSGGAGGSNANLSSSLGLGGVGGKAGVSGANVISPLYSFDEADDYVYDVKWHPSHPAVFGSVDGSGRFDLWNLNADTEVRCFRFSLGVSSRADFGFKVPVVSTSVGTGRAINKLAWDRKDGRRAAMGGADGRLYVYDIGDMATPRETEWKDLQKTVAGLAGGVGATVQTNGVPSGSVPM